MDRVLPAAEDREVAGRVRVRDRRSRPSVRHPRPRPSGRPSRSSLIASNSMRAFTGSVLLEPDAVVVRLARAQPPVLDVPDVRSGLGPGRAERAARAEHRSPPRADAVASAGTEAERRPPRAVEVVLEGRGHDVERRPERGGRRRRARRSSPHRTPWLLPGGTHATGKSSSEENGDAGAMTGRGGSSRRAGLYAQAPATGHGMHDLRLLCMRKPGMHPILFRIPLPHAPLKLWWGLVAITIIAFAFAGVVAAEQGQGGSPLWGRRRVRAPGSARTSGATSPSIRPRSRSTRTASCSASRSSSAGTSRSRSRRRTVSPRRRWPTATS